MSKIRPFRETDYKEVCELLMSNNVGLPHEISDLGGICLVAEKNGEIVGVIWALIGNSTQAYVGYFAIKDHNIIIGKTLNDHLETILMLHGVKRYTFFTLKENLDFLPIAKGLGNYMDSITGWREL